MVVAGPVPVGGAAVGGAVADVVGTGSFTVRLGGGVTGSWAVGRESAEMSVVPSPAASGVSGVSGPTSGTSDATSEGGVSTDVLTVTGVGFVAIRGRTTSTPTATATTASISTATPPASTNQIADDDLRAGMGVPSTAAKVEPSGRVMPDSDDGSAGCTSAAGAAGAAGALGGGVGPPIPCNVDGLRTGRWLSRGSGTSEAL